MVETLPSNNGGYGFDSQLGEIRFHVPCNKKKFSKKENKAILQQIHKRLKNCTHLKNITDKKHNETLVSNLLSFYNYVAITVLGPGREQKGFPRDLQFWW